MRPTSQAKDVVNVRDEHADHSERGHRVGRFWRRYGTTRLRRAAMIFALASLLLCAFSSALAGLAGATAGISAWTQASQGYTHLKNGETLLKSLTTGSLSATVTRARAEFTASQQDFTQAHANLARLPGFDYSAPIVGNKLQMALQLTALAANFSQMGVEACDAGTIVIGAVSNPFGGSLAGGSPSASSTPGPTPTPTATPSPTFTPVTPSKNGITPEEFATVQAKLNSIDALLNDSTAQINALNPRDFSFDASIASEVGALKAALPQIRQYLGLAMSILPVAGPLLGVDAPAKYLVELPDSTELRPGGGFIGNYGVLVMSGGILSSLHVIDVDLLDRPFEANGGPYGAPGCIQAPPQYQWFTNVVVPCWSLRDSNLSANFPTTATNGEKNYALEGGKDTFQGVISITPWLIEKLIAITGPVTVPEFKAKGGNGPVIVTSTNMMDLIHCAQLCPRHSSCDCIAPPLVFTADLFKHFMELVKTKLKTDKTAFAKAALDGLATKDLQLYFNNPQAEALLTNHYVDSAIQAPKTGDSLMVVDTNIIANKANNFFTYTMDDQVSINGAGMATHHLTLRYTWPQSSDYEQNAYGSFGAKWMYEAYLRVYAPPQAQLVHTTGWWDYQGAHPAYGRQVYTGYIRMSYHSSNPALAIGPYPVTTGPYPNEMTITLDYTVPNAATHKGNVWTYPLLIQHQAGHAPYALWNITETVTPTCGKVSSVEAPWQVSAGAKSATLQEALSADKSYTMTYTCAS